MLASSEEEEEEDPQIDFEYLLFVMAQTGGFMYFLKTVFGILLSCWNARMFLMEILNKQRAYKQKQDQKIMKAHSAFTKKNQPQAKGNINKMSEDVKMHGKYP